MHQATIIKTTDPSDTIKMIRETLCVAQHAVGRVYQDGRTRVHMDRLQRLIDDCDRQRPLGVDGKHGVGRCTPTCGCDPIPDDTRPPFQFKGRK